MTVLVFKCPPQSPHCNPIDFCDKLKKNINSQQTCSNWLMLFCQYTQEIFERCLVGLVPRRTLAVLKNKRNISKHVIYHLGRRKAQCVHCWHQRRCADMYPYRPSDWRIRHCVISVLSLASVSIFDTCCNLSILPPPSKCLN